MTTDNFCFYLQNRLVQTSQTGGQWYSNTSPFSIPWLVDFQFGLRRRKRGRRSRLPRQARILETNQGHFSQPFITNKWAQ